MTDINRTNRGAFRHHLLTTTGAMLALGVLAPGTAWAQDETAATQTAADPLGRRNLRDRATA